MIRRLIRASHAHPLPVVLATVLLVAVGGASYRDLPADVFPDLSAPIFNVIAQNSAMAPEELEASIVIPLEVALSGLPQVRRLRSQAQLGVAVVTVEFESDVDYKFARQMVAERVAQAGGTLPPGTEPPLVSSLTGRLNEIFEITLEGTADLMTLRDVAEFEVSRRLAAVPGVAAVERLGGHLREVQVLMDPDRMTARGVTLDDVLDAVEAAGDNTAGGIIAQGSMEWTVRAVARPEGVADLQRAVVSSRGGVPILLSDVAEVREGGAVRRGMAHRLHGEVVSCRISKQFGADTMTVAAGIREALSELRQGLPPGVEIHVAYDQSALVDGALRGVGKSIALGAFLVVLVLLLMLGHVRAALLVTVVLPMSVLVAGTVLKTLGVGINTMTLGGLAIAVGLLVDAAIIMVENVVHHLQRKETTGRTSELRAALEVGPPIVFATAIVVAVFIPLLAMEGLEGRMFRPLAVAVAACMGASLLLSLTLIPAVGGRWMGGVRGQGDVVIVRMVKRVYVPLLGWCMRHAGKVRLATLLVTLPLLGLATRIGTEFMPEIDEGALLIQTVVAADASLEEVDARNHRAEDALRKFPEVVDVVRRTGRSERTEDPMPHTISDVLVILREDRTRDHHALTAAMREEFERAPGIGALFTTPLGMRVDEGLGGTPADISVRVFGNNLDTLGLLAGQVRERLERIPGLTDVNAEPLTGFPQVRITLDREAAMRVGLTGKQLSRTVGAGLAGVTMGHVWRDGRQHRVVARLSEERRHDVLAIRALPLDTPAGMRVPLSQVARIEETFGPGVIRREAGTRRMAVDAAVVGRDLGSAVQDVRAALSELKLPKGYFFSIAGKVESQARAQRSLLVAMAISLFLVFLLLYLALGSLAETLVILATLPDALVGAVVAIYLAGETWNVSSAVGVIGLFGIAVQNGLVLVTQTRALVAQGRPFAEALEEAAVGRVRPKLMTAGTAILGLMPLVVLRGQGSEIERPLAIAMMGGLCTSTLFTLLALPTFYLFVEQLRERARSRAK
ncbi:MAG: efflux RND transporter permease subunit [Myxococcota bacterium]